MHAYMTMLLLCFASVTTSTAFQTHCGCPTRFSSLFSHTPPQLGRCLLGMSNTMIAGATKIWYYVPTHKTAAFETWLNATRPGYIENLEAGAPRCFPCLTCCGPCSCMQSAHHPAKYNHHRLSCIWPASLQPLGVTLYTLSWCHTVHIVSTQHGRETSQQHNL